MKICINQIFIFNQKTNKQTKKLCKFLTPKFESFLIESNQCIYENCVGVPNEEEENYLTINMKDSSV